jgi:putative transposase
MKDLRLHYPLCLLCRAFDVSPSGYQAWDERPLSKQAQGNARLEVAMVAAHQRTRQTYGARRLQPELAAAGFMASVGRIRRLRKKLGLQCPQKRRFKATTDSNHHLPVAPNLLQQTFTATQPNQKWVTDITYVATDEGWLYLAGIKDLYTCEIVGYALSARMTTELVSHALNQAVMTKRPAAGLVHHSDRGSQYCSHAYQGLVRQFGMQASMSRRGNCYDNAPMESFWGTLKNELIHQRRYATRQQAIDEITEYIEIFYNRQRRHSTIGYIAPATFARQFYQQQQQQQQI